MNKGIAILRWGGIVAYPTDTLYGLGAHAFLEPAVERVFRAKGRLHSQALPLLLADASDLEWVAAEVPPVALRLTHRFWPGGLTLVLFKSGRVPQVVTGGSKTVALRVPDHPIPRDLVRHLGAPITGTSANRSGGPDPTTAEEVARQLGQDVELIIDGGSCPAGVGSTVLDLTGPTPRVLRVGIISTEELEEVCGPVDVLPDKAVQG